MDLASLVEANNNALYVALALVALCLVSYALYWIRLRIKRFQCIAKQRVDHYVEQAKALLRSQSQNDVADAVTLLDETIEETPPWLDPPLLELKARSLMRLHRYEAILELLPDYLPDISKRAAVSSESLQYYRKREILHPDEFWKIVFLGQACYHLGRLDEALILLQRAKWQSRMASQNSTASLVSQSSSIPPGEDGFEGTDPSGLPLEALNRLIAVIKFLVRRRAAGEAAFDNNMYYEAVRQYSRVLDSKKAPPQALASALYLDRSAAFEKLNRFPEAISDCTKASALNPDSKHAIWRRALLYKTLKCPEETAKDVVTLLQKLRVPRCNSTLSAPPPNQALLLFGSRLIWVVIRVVRRLGSRFNAVGFPRMFFKRKLLAPISSPGTRTQLPLPETAQELESLLTSLREETSLLVDHAKVLGLESAGGPQANGKHSQLGQSSAPGMKAGGPRVAFRVASLRQDLSRVTGFMERWGGDTVREEILREGVRLQGLLDRALEEAVRGSEEVVSEGMKDCAVEVRGRSGDQSASVDVDLVSSGVGEGDEGNKKRGGKIGGAWRLVRRIGSRPLGGARWLEERAPLGGQFDSLLTWLRVEKPVGGGLLDEPDLGVMGSLEDLPLQSLNPQELEPSVAVEQTSLEDSGGNHQTGPAGGGRGKFVSRGIRGVFGGLGLGLGHGAGEGGEGKGRSKEKGKEKDRDKVKDKEKGKEKVRERFKDRVKGKKGGEEETSGKDAAAKEKGKDKERGRWRKITQRSAEESDSTLLAHRKPHRSDCEEEGDIERMKKLTRRLGIIMPSIARPIRRPREEVEVGGKSEGRADPVAGKDVRHLSKKLLEFGQRSISPLRRPRRSIILGEEGFKLAYSPGSSRLERTESFPASHNPPEIFPPNPPERHPRHIEIPPKPPPNTVIGAWGPGTSPRSTSPSGSSDSSALSHSSASPLTSISAPSSPSVKSTPLMPIEDIGLEKQSPSVLPRFLFPRKRSKSLESYPSETDSDFEVSSKDNSAVQECST